MRVRPPGGQDGSGRASGACGPPRRGPRGLLGSRRQCRRSRSSASGGASSVSGRLLDRPPNEIEQGGDGDLQDHRQEEDRPEPLHASGSVPLARPLNQGLDMVLGEADIGGRLRPRKWGRSARPPRPDRSRQSSRRPTQALVCRRSDRSRQASSGLCRSVPCRRRSGRGVSPGSPRISGAARSPGPPSRWPRRSRTNARQPLSMPADPVGDAMRHPVDQVEPPGGLAEGALEAEQADHAVDVEGEYGMLLRHDLSVTGLWSGPRSGALYHSPPCLRPVS